MKHRLFVTIVLLSLSSYTWSADTQTNQPGSAVEAPSQGSSAPQQDDQSAALKNTHCCNFISMHPANIPSMVRPFRWKFILSMWQ